MVTNIDFLAPVTCVNSNSDDSKLVASAKDQTAFVWNTDENNKLRYGLVGHMGVVVI
jgi:hypothetical protein